MTVISRSDVTAMAQPAKLAKPAKPAKPTTHATDAKPRSETATTKATDATDATATGFAKQLQKATKPVVKKPTAELGEPTAAQGLVQATPDTSALAQLIAAIVNAGTMATPPTGAPQPDVEDPKIALTAAGARAAATTTATATIGDDATVNALVEQMVAVEPEVAPQLAPAAPPLTPLEQAVHDMLSEVAERKQASGNGADPTTAMQSVSLVPQQTINSLETALEAQHAAPIAQPPQELVSQNHAHLVIDDPNGRVVMTVAIRGNDVNVTMRASDDATAAALARNAGSLEDAMRGRGLSLAQFESQRDLAREQNSDKPRYQQREKQPNTPAFTLEDNS